MPTEAELQRSLGCEVIDNTAAYVPYRVNPAEERRTEKPLRIGVSGAQGTGITTTARGLAQRLQLPLLSEVARTAFEHGFTLGDEGSIKAQCAMWFSQVFLEHRAGSFVSDRTVIDAVAHAELLADMTGDKEDRMVATAMGNASLPAMADFDLLFYTPIEFALEFDGVRKGDMDFQQQLDKKFEALIERFNLPYVIVRGSIEERLDQATLAVEAAGKTPTLG